MQNTTRFGELFLHSTDKPCSRLLTENQHSLCYTLWSLPQWRVFSKHYWRGHHRPSRTDTSPMNCIYAWIKHTLQPPEPGNMFKKICTVISSTETTIWPKVGTLPPYAWQTRGMWSLNCRWSDRRIRMKAVISPKCSQQGNFLRE